MRKIAALIVMAGFLAACGPQPAPDEVPPAPPLRIEISADLEWMRPALAQCSEATPGVSLIVDTIPLRDQSLQDADVLFRWSVDKSSDGESFEIGEDRLAVIINNGSPAIHIDSDTLSKVFAGQITDWSAVVGAATGDIQPWIYPAEMDAQVLATQLFFEGVQLDKQVRIAPDPAAMIQAVAQDSRAIGYVPAAWLDSSVKEIEVRGLEDQFKIIPILAVTPSEPVGAARDWLLCLQDKLKP
jgi:DNA-binding transcriptional LysR family regulator